MTDDQDRPEEGGYALAVPFVVCASKGGPFDDEAFVAGYQCGDIDRALTAIAAAGGNRAEFTVRSVLVHQLELLAMYRGFPSTTVREFEEAPEWTLMTFRTGGSQEGPQP